MFAKPVLEEGSSGEEDVGIEEDSVDERAYESLLSDIRKLSSKKRVGVTSSVRFSTRPADGIHAGDILKVLANDRLQNASEKVRALEAPLEKETAKRMRRQAGFDTVAVEVGKWESLIHSRRNADQLSFPLENTSVKVEAVNKVTSLKPRTQLEHDVYSLLKGAQLIDDKKETPEEEARRKAMSLDEIWERNREIMRERLVRQRWEKKAALQNKSKSKNYHRILRRQRLRKQKVELENLQKADPAAALEKLQELENARIRERIDLRHRQSRWAHLRSLRAKDPSSIAALQENARLHEELKQKLKLKSSNDDLSASDEEEPEDVMKEGTCDPDNPWTSDLREDNRESEISKDLQDGFANFKKFWDEFNQRKAEEKAQSIEGDCNQQLQKRKNMDLVDAFITNEKTERDIKLGQRENVRGSRNEKEVASADSLKSETRKNDKRNKKKIIDKKVSLSDEVNVLTNEDSLKTTKSSKKKKNHKACKKLDAFSYISGNEVKDTQKKNIEDCENWKNDGSSDNKIGVGRNDKQSNKTKEGSKKISASDNVAAVANDKLKKTKSSKKAKKYQISKAVSAAAAGLNKTCNKGSKEKVDVDGQDVGKSGTRERASSGDCKNEEKNGKFLSQMRKTIEFQGLKVNTAVENLRKDTNFINKKKASKKIRSIKKVGKNVDEIESFKHDEEKIKKNLADTVKEEKLVKSPTTNITQLKDDSDDDYFVDVAFEKAGSKASKAVQEKLKVVETELRVIAESQMPGISDSEEIGPMHTMEYDFTVHDKEETLNEGLIQLRTEEEIEALQEIAEGISAKKGAVIFSAIKDDIVKEAKCDHSTLPGAKQMTTGGISEEGASSIKRNLTDVDPTNFIQVPCKKLKTALPDTVKGHSWSDDDSEGLEEECAENMLQEAFADDYSLMDFKSEKQASKENLLKGLDDTLPGWGSWTGPGTKASKKRTKKITTADLIVNAKMPPKKFDGQENVIYNEEADMHSNLRTLMVSELPHPFLRVRDFESSIRAPVGRTFVPENVHLKLIAPPIITKMGTVIPPMDESALLQSGCQ